MKFQNDSTDDPTEDTAEDANDLDYIDDLEADPSTTAFGFGASSFDKPTFNEDNLKYATLMGSAPYLKDILGHVIQASITERYKREIVSCLYALFANEQVLGNTSIRKTGKFGTSDPLRYNLLFAQRNLEITRGAATQEDMLAINVLALEKNIMSVYEAYISRSVGDKRERLINNEVSTKSVQQTEVTRPYEMPETKQKKSFWSFRLGRR